MPHLQEDEDHEQPISNNTSPSSTPRKAKRNNSICKNHNNKDKNPYSKIGLDKFSALLSDLDEKRQKIYAETGDQDKTFVRFVYNNSNDVVPIVVKLKDKIKDDQKPKIHTEKQGTNNSEDHNLDKFPIETSLNTKQVKQQQSSESAQSKNNKNKRRENNLSWSYYMKFDRWRRPSYYLPVVVILILLFLALFGRSVSILCASIGWYMVPTLKNSSNKKRSNKKKYFINHHESKKFSENKLVIDKVSSPKSSILKGV